MGIGIVIVIDGFRPLASLRLSLGNAPGHDITAAVIGCVRTQDIAVRIHADGIKLLPGCVAHGFARRAFGRKSVIKEMAVRAAFILWLLHDHTRRHYGAYPGWSAQRRVSTVCCRSAGAAGS